MVIKINGITGSDHLGSDSIRWIKNRLPIPFLKQQLLLVLIASSLLFILTTFFTSDIEHDNIQNISDELNYGVIIDCGSSGSRAHIFKWKKNPNSNHIELIRDTTRGKHITPGLSSLKSEPDKASEYMEPIMHFISDVIPHEKHLDTPVHFLATAGLRLLDESTQKAILVDITRDLRAKFDFPNLKCQVISGEYEGIYSWISLNLNRKLRDSQHPRTYGMIEMGGASIQVAFELDSEVESAILSDLKTPDAIAAFKSEQLTLNVNPGNSVKLFATTFLGLGVNSAREAAIDLLVRDFIEGAGRSDVEHHSDLSKFEVRLHDPCLTTGSSEIILRPTALLDKSNQSIGLVVKQAEQTFKVQLDGSGDFMNCMAHLERVVQIAKKERLNCVSSKQTCPTDLLGTNFIPYNLYPFVGLSEMFFTTNEMMNSAGLFNRSKILHETKRICTTKYNALLEAYAENASSPDERVLYECFKASWLLTILHRSGLNMPDDYDSFQTVDKLDGEEIDWTTGAMIMEVALKN